MSETEFIKILSKKIVILIQGGNLGKPLKIVGKKEIESIQIYLHKILYLSLSLPVVGIK